MHWSLPLALVLAACASPPPPPATDYVFVFLKTGPAKDIPAERMRELMNGHFANMQRLGNEGQLLIAGPLGAPRVDPAHRGVFVFDTADLAQAREFASTDPSVAAGVFELELVPWRTDAPLRELRALDRALQEKTPPDAGPGANARSYVLVGCDDAAAARNALAPLFAEGTVLFFGECGGARAGEALLALDVETLEQAQASLARATTPIAWRVHPWFASQSLTQLAR